MWYSKKLTLHSAWDIADAQSLVGLFLAALHWRSVSGREVFCTGVVLEGLLMPCTPGSVKPLMAMTVEGASFDFLNAHPRTCFYCF